MRCFLQNDSARLHNPPPALGDRGSFQPHFYYLTRVNSVGDLTNQSQTAEVIRSPACLYFDDAAKGAEAEGVRGVMEGKRDATTIGVLVVPVTALLSL